MAASGMYPGPVQSAPKVVALPQQKKVMDDVLECIIQLKSEFFENHQPINDDNVSLQRLCAKLEHLIQMGMREKTSLLGRKKDYWDYLCDCLGSAKGSNEGIRYVKNLRENKTSLGRGRAFVRFCLVHQRLADALQQCLVHSDKTSLWFIPSSVLCNRKDANTLISALYDLNSMHFDLSPRGYDLDSDWPSFANRKMAPGGSWNIPISRRSSITSMDTISQASISMAASPDVDRLHKDLEAAHSARYDVQEQLGTLQKEKEEASQSAWESQGKVATLQEQLNTTQSQHASLQERYRELDVNFVKMKLEKDHLEKLLSDERKVAKEQESKRVQQLQGEEEVWKREMREEGERRRKEIDKLQEELQTKSGEEEEDKRMIGQYWDCLVALMSDFKIEVSSQQDFLANVENVRAWMDGVDTQLKSLSTDKALNNSEASKTQSDMERLTKELESAQQQLSKMEENKQDLNQQISCLGSKLDEKCQEFDSQSGNILLLGKDTEKYQEEILSLRELNQELKDKEKTLKELNETMKERMISEHSRKTPVESNFDFGSYLHALFERDERVLELQNQMSAVQRKIKTCVNGEGEHEEVETVELMERLKSDVNAVLTEREDMLRSMLSELQAIELKSGKFEKEVDMLGHGGQALNEQLSTSEARVEILSSRLRDEEVRMVEVMSEHDRALQVVNQGKEEVEQERDGLMGRISELSSQIDSCSRDNKGLQKRLKDMEGERQHLQENLSSSQNEIEEINKNLCHEKEKIAALLQDSDGERDSKAEILQQITKLQSEKEEVRVEKEEAVSCLQKENRQLVEKLDALQSDNQSLTRDIESVKMNVDKEKEIDTEYCVILEQLNKKLVQAVKQCEHSLRSRSHGVVTCDGENTQPDSSAESNVDQGLLKTEVDSNMKTLYDSIKHLCESRDQMEETTRNQLTVVLEEEKGRLLGEVDAALEETHHIKYQLEQTSELLTASNSSLDTIATEKESLQSKVSSMLEEISKQEAERDELQSKMAAMVEEISRHEAEKDELRREMGVLKTDCNRAEDDAQEKLGQKRELEVKLEEMEEKFESVLSEKLTLEKAAEGLYSQSEFSHKVLEESLTDVQTALEAVKAEKMELEERCSSLETAKRSLEDRLQTSTEKCQALENDLDKAQGDSDRDSDVASLKQKLEEEKARYELDIDTLNSEISALQFQMSSAYIEEQEELQTGSGYSMTGTQSTMEDLEAEVKRLEEENDTLRSGMQDETQHNEFVLKIESLESQLKSYERTMMEMQSSVEEAESSKEEMSLELTQLQLSAKKRLEDRDKELQVLTSDNEGMKRQLLKLIKDKDNLWQKTDALVDERKRHASDRWMDNSKVNQCGLCKAEFSLFLRKHHCRLCGKIFCWACSDHWLDTAHSSKKARVCTTCFDQKTNPDASLMATSLIDNESDNEDDDSTSSTFMHTCNEEGKVEIREVFHSRAKKNGDCDDDDDDDDDDDTNETDEGKLRQSTRRSPSIDTRKNGSNRPGRLPYEMETDSLEDSIYNATAEIRVNVPASGTGAAGDDNGNEDDVDDTVYQVITQAEVAKTMTDYKSRPAVTTGQTNMTSSMVLSADELEAGDVNRQNEVWIRPGRQFVVPIRMGEVQDGSLLSWEFSSQPKDIVFSLKFSAVDGISLSDAEEIVAPCKCDAHKQVFKGELTPKRSGVYTLVFDNTYSRMTSKKVHYYLQYRTSP